MSLSLEQLLGKLRPGEGPQVSAVIPPESSGARSVVDPAGFLAMIEMMREQREYGFADDTLRGIYDTVEKTKTVTEGQHAAVLKIRHSVKNWEDLE